MKKLLIGAALVAASASALAQNVSIAVGQPGFYGRIDIGDTRPVLVSPRPVVISAPRYAVQPVYLRVPPYQRAHWGRYCGAYGACGMPVYFVSDDWYERVYVPRYREVHRYGPPPREWRGDRDEWRDRDHDKGHGHAYGRRGKDDDDRDHDRGHRRD
jgi:hypothetical protein